MPFSSGGLGQTGCRLSPQRPTNHRAHWPPLLDLPFVDAALDQFEGLELLVCLPCYGFRKLTLDASAQRNPGAASNSIAVIGDKNFEYLT
jgi:hypothetical protein